MGEKDKKKKILVFIDWYLPGTNSGGPVRSLANLISHLNREFDFFVVTRNKDFCSENVYKNIKSNRWIPFNDNTKVFYISSDSLSINALKKAVKKIKPEVVYINGLYSWFFSILPLILFKRKYRLIISTRGMLSPQAFSVKGNKKKVFLRLARLYGLYKNVLFHATNKQEKKYIQNILGKRAQIHVAPNFPRAIIQEYKEKNVGEIITFVNVSRISIEKGTLNMIKSFYNVKNKVSLDIYGPIYDISYWAKCKEIIKKLPDNVFVSYKGTASSEDIPKILQQYNYFILLSEGENFGHAIYEALCASCPVIISDKTPWQNLELNGIGWDLDINDVNKVTSVLNYATNISLNKYRNMSKLAYEYAVTFSENPELINKNIELFS